MFNSLKRLWNLLFGWMGLGIKRIEEKHPEIAFENAINSMIQKYARLKSGAAGLIKHRVKLQARVAKAQAGLDEIGPMIETAVDSGEDDVALMLLTQQEDLKNSLVEAQGDLEESTKDADAAKASLSSMKIEIDKLKREKDKVLAQIADASARKAIQDQLDGLSIDDDLKALENVREHAASLRAEVQIGDELEENSIDHKLAAIRTQTKNATAQSKLAMMKAARSGSVDNKAQALTERAL